MSPNIEFFSAVPVLLCQDIDKSITFYTEQVGFSLFWIDESARNYAVLFRDSAALHLASAANGKSQPSLAKMSSCHPADANFFIQGVDALFQELQAKGVSTLGEPTDQAYGIRDLSIIDPDGYEIRFNEAVGDEDFVEDVCE